MWSCGKERETGTGTLGQEGFCVLAKPPLSPLGACHQARIAAELGWRERPKGIGRWGDGELSKALKAVDKGGKGVMSHPLPRRTLVRMSRVGASRAHPANFHPKHKKKTVASLNDDWKEGEEEEGEGFRERIVRRAVRKYPEDAGDHVEAGHRQISIPMGRAEGSCPEVLAKGTLAVVVAALAFLGFFSTSVLLVVAVCILRMVDKQRKIGKEGKSGYPPSRRTLPPMPPPRPDRTYMTMRSAGPDRLRPATPHAPEDGYLSVSELNPGPRTRQKLHYQNVSESSPPKTPVERERIIPEGAQPFSSPPSAKKYENVEESHPTAVMGGSPEIGMTPQGHDNHIYEQVE